DCGISKQLLITGAHTRHSDASQSIHLFRLRFQSSQTPLAADLALLDARDALDFGEGAHEVAAENFQNVLFAVTAPQKFIRDVRQIFHAAYAFGQRDAAVEVGAEA